METTSHGTPGYLIWRVSMKFRTAVDRAMAPLGLTHAQYSLLASLYGKSQDGSRPSQRELADHTGLDPVYVSKLVRTLEGAGLVLRSSHPGDSRAVQLALTELGADTATRAVAVVRELTEELMGTLGGTRSARSQGLVSALHALLEPTKDDRSDTMTQPSTAPAPATLNGRDIALAATATRSLLDALLSREEISFGESLAVRTIADAGDGGAVRGELSRALDATPTSPPLSGAALLDGLAAKGLVNGSQDRVALTASGRALSDRVQRGTDEIIAALYSDFDPAELEVTRRVLNQVTERATQLRAAGGPGSGRG
jgi:DNA-binding MarR family transcriptional regulator